MIRILMGEGLMWGAIAGLLFSCPTDPRWIASYVILAIIGATWQIGGKIDGAA